MGARTARALGVIGVSLLAAGAGLGIGQARAAEWMQVSCVNPSGSAAGAAGWSTDVVGIPEPGSVDSASCGPGTPLTASLSDSSPAPTGVAEALEYQPPSGSALVGGELDLELAAQSGGGAAGGAAVYDPAFVDDENDVFGVCSAVIQPCQNGTNTFQGTLAIPANRGGDLFAAASCIGGSSGDTCNTNSLDGTWALVEIDSAHILLSTSAVPEGSGFSGGLLQRNASGAAPLVFEATDTGGPGIQTVTVAIDGHPVYAGTPESNGGACAPVGTDPSTGAPMYDASQPCPATEALDLPIPTAGFPDGSHELTVAVTDAAGTTSTVLDQRITTFNPQSTPVPRGRHSVRARFLISWRWAGSRTQLRSISASKLPRGARMSVDCRGRRCPRLPRRASGGRAIARLLHRLAGIRFDAGDVLALTVSAPRRDPERIELRIRRGGKPSARLL